MSPFELIRSVTRVAAVERIIAPSHHFLDCPAQIIANPRLALVSRAMMTAGARDRQPTPVSSG
jgi:hypothetical protein